MKKGECGKICRIEGWIKSQDVSTCVDKINAYDPITVLEAKSIRMFTILVPKVGCDSYLHPHIFVNYLQQTLLYFTFADTAPHMWKRSLSILLSRVSYSTTLLET